MPCLTLLRPWMERIEVAEQGTPSSCPSQAPCSWKDLLMQPYKMVSDSLTLPSVPGPLVG